MNELTPLTRVFVHKDKASKTIKLPDPNPTYAPHQVLDFYASEYPELTTASVGSPTVKNDKQVFEFKTTLGTKG